MNNKTFILVLIAILGVLGLTSCNNTNARFDLSDQKTFWSGTMDDEFKTNRV